MSVLFWTQKAAITLIMNGGNQSPLSLHKMHSYKSLTLWWRSFSEQGSDRVLYCFAKEGRQYIGYG